MHFNIYDLFYLLFSHQHVWAPIFTSIFKQKNINLKMAAIAAETC
jgi:hypothetical protein